MVLGRNLSQQARLAVAGGFPRSHGDPGKGWRGPGTPIRVVVVPIDEEGVATVEDMDLAIKLGLNWPMGPLTLADFVGLDTLLYISDYFVDEFKDGQDFLGR